MAKLKLQKAISIIICAVMALALTIPMFASAAETVPAPTIGMAVNLRDGIELGWEEVENVDGYYLYRSDNGGSFKKIANITEANAIIEGNTIWYMDTNLVNGSKYAYKMKAYRSKTTSAYSAKKTTYRIETTKVSAVNQTKGIKVTWDKVDGAAGYKVYRKELDGEYKLLSTKVGEDNCSFVNTSTQIGKVYCYMVKPYITPVTVNYYNHEENAVMIARLTKIQNVSAELLSNRKIKVSWKPTPGVEGYIISQKNNTTGKATNFIVSYQDTDEYRNLQSALENLDMANENLALIMEEHEDTGRQVTEAEATYNNLIAQQATLQHEATTAYATYEEKMAQANSMIEEANNYYDTVCEPIPLEDDASFEQAYAVYVEMMNAAHDVQVEAYTAYDTYLAKSNSAHTMEGPIFQASAILSNATNQYQYELDEDIPVGEACVAEAQATVNAAQAACDAFMATQAGELISKTVNPTSVGEFSYTVRSYVGSFRSDFSNKALVTKP